MGIKITSNLVRGKSGVVWKIPGTVSRTKLHATLGNAKVRNRLLRPQYFIKMCKDMQISPAKLLSLIESKDPELANVIRRRLKRKPKPSKTKK